MTQNDETPTEGAASRESGESSTVVSIEGTAWPPNWPLPGENGPQVTIVGKGVDAIPVTMHLTIAKPKRKPGRPPKIRGYDTKPKTRHKLPEGYTEELMLKILTEARRVPKGSLAAWVDAYSWPQKPLTINQVRYWIEKLKSELEPLVAQQSTRIILVPVDETGRSMASPNTLSRKRRRQGQRTPKAQAAHVRQRGAKWGENRLAELEETRTGMKEELDKLTEELKLTGDRELREKIKLHIRMTKMDMREAKQKTTSILSQKRKQTKGKSSK